MVNPKIKHCPANVWQKVAHNVHSVSIHKMDSLSYYYYTYRDANSPPPHRANEAVKIPDGGVRLDFDTMVDIYVYCKADHGDVRVDVHG